MNWSMDIINALFGGPGRTAVLRLLASQSTALTGRQIAELARLSPRGAAQVLDHFGELGVVRRRRVGRAITHELERDNLLVSSIILPALAAERSLTEQLQSDVAQTFGAEAESVTLFGSMVTGNAGPGSDIDVLVVTADHPAAERASSIADVNGPRFFRRYGMPLSVVVTSRDSLPMEPGGFMASARDNGVCVAGRPLAELMPRAAK